MDLWFINCYGPHTHDVREREVYMGPEGGGDCVGRCTSRQDLILLLVGATDNSDG
jgi:hypothetical protein